MINTILSALRENNIPTYFITRTEKSSAELFFIKKKLDLSRGTDVCDYTVKVFRDFTKGEDKLTGSAEINIEAGMAPAEVSEKIKNAYEAAEYAGNPAFSFSDGVKDTKPAPDNALSRVSLEEAALKMTEALFRNDTSDDPFINSAEIFITKKDVRIVGGNGCDVSYTTFSAKGEFVSQCRVKNDVELFRQFSYDDLCADELAQKVKEALETVKSRSAAEKPAPRGERTIILSDECVETIMSYYGERALDYMIYSGYSPFKRGMDVMGETEGDRVTMRFIAKEPFSEEGIPMTDRLLLDSGVLQTIHGNTRLCSYLGEEPTGVYRAAQVNCGSMSFEQMKQSDKSVLQLVSFSDFQMNSLTGFFGGEIRLGYLYENGTVTPVTGGSVNGNFIELQKNMRLSSEKQISSTFEGSKYIMFPGVPVNGE